MEIADAFPLIPYDYNNITTESVAVICCCLLLMRSIFHLLVPVKDALAVQWHLNQLPKRLLFKAAIVVLVTIEAIGSQRKTR